MEKKPMINLGPFSIIIEAFKLLFGNGQIFVLLIPFSIIFVFDDLLALNDAAQMRDATSLAAFQEAIARIRARIIPEAALELFFFPWVWFFSRAAVAVAVGFVYSSQQVNFAVVTTLCKSWKRIAITTICFILAQVVMVVMVFWVLIDNLIVLLLTKTLGSNLIKILIFSCLMVVLFMLLLFVLWYRAACSLTAVVTALEDEQSGFEAFKRSFKLLSRSRRSAMVGTCLEFMFTVCCFLTSIGLSAGRSILVNGMLLLVNILVQTLFAVSAAIFYLVSKDMDNFSTEGFIMGAPVDYVEV